MICDSCHGTGWIRRELREPIPIREEAQGPGRPNVIVEAIAIRLPCPECGGSAFSADATHSSSASTWQE